MIFTDDPVKDAEAWLAEQDDYEATLPVCCVCDNPIDDSGWYYDVNGEYYCHDCLLDTFRKDIADYGQ